MNENIISFNVAILYHGMKMLLESSNVYKTKNSGVFKVRVTIYNCVHRNKLFLASNVLSLDCFIKLLTFLKINLFIAYIVFQNVLLIL